MRKIKLSLQYRVPSWNFCNSDVPVDEFTDSKEVCRFCVSTKKGKRCVLFDAALAADENYIYKAPPCIEASAGYVVEVEEPTKQPAVQPKVLIRETIKEYNKLMNDLLKQGYPRSLAESIAAKQMTGEI